MLHSCYLFLVMLGQSSLPNPFRVSLLLVFCATATTFCHYTDSTIYLHYVMLGVVLPSHESNLTIASCPNVFELLLDYSFSPLHQIVSIFCNIRLMISSTRLARTLALMPYSFPTLWCRLGIYLSKRSFCLTLPKLLIAHSSPLTWAVLFPCKEHTLTISAVAYQH